MTMYELKNRFMECKDYPANDVNQLLDFAKKEYIHNNINIQEYRLLVRDLEALGAMIPESDQDDLSLMKYSI